MDTSYCVQRPTGPVWHLDGGSHGEAAAFSSGASGPGGTTTKERRAHCHEAYLQIIDDAVLTGRNTLVAARMLVHRDLEPNLVDITCWSSIVQGCTHNDAGDIMKETSDGIDLQTELSQVRSNDNATYDG